MVFLNKCVELIYDSDKEVYGYAVENKIIGYGLEDFETAEKEAIKYAITNNLDYQFDLDFSIDLVKIAIDGNDFVGLEFDNQNVLTLKSYGFLSKELADAILEKGFYEGLTDIIREFCKEEYTYITALVTAKDVEEAKEHKII